MRISPDCGAGPVLDRDLEPQRRGQVLLERAGVGVLRRRARHGARRGVRRRGAGERLGLAHREVAVDHLPRQRLRVRRGDEGPGVTGGQAAVAQHGEHRLGQGQQPQQVGDVAAALAERLGQPLLGVAEAVHQLPVALRLLERVEVGALHVLDDRQLEHLGVGERAHHRRQRMHAGELRRPPAALAGDDLVVAGDDRVRAQDQRLDHALLADRGREVGEFLLVEVAAAAGSGWRGCGRSARCRPGPSAPRPATPRRHWQHRRWRRRRAAPRDRVRDPCVPCRLLRSDRFHLPRPAHAGQQLAGEALVGEAAAAGPVVDQRRNRVRSAPR